MAKESTVKKPSDETPQKEEAQAAETNESGSQYDGTNILRKLSPKTIMGKIKRPNAGDPDASPPVPPDSPKSLYVIMGQTHGLKTGAGDNGPWTAFVGQFEAVRSDNGERYIGGLCFVPKAFEEMLINAVKTAQKGDENASVEFAIEVGMKPSNAAVGYEFWVKNLIKAASADPLADLRNRVMKALPPAALPAPK